MLYDPWKETNGIELDRERMERGERWMERDKEEDEGKDGGCRRDEKEQDTNWYTSNSIVILVPFFVCLSLSFMSLTLSLSPYHQSLTRKLMEMCV